ncbi:MAG: hypothetical protein DHS80DRAFT_25845 [Piptocephalis tieghemiana]|nr:MAG: hypothetical protein DHS80DRAFT_25845 [Piptocephalis tieghemiana]
MDLDWCPTCDRHVDTPNQLYCSAQCKEMDSSLPSPASSRPSSVVLDSSINYSQYPFLASSPSANVIRFGPGDRSSFGHAHSDKSHADRPERTCTVPPPPSQHAHTPRIPPSLSQGYSLPIGTPHSPPYSSY